MLCDYPDIKVTNGYYELYTITSHNRLNDVDNTTDL